MLSPAVAQYDIQTFDCGAEGPWSDLDRTTVDVPWVEDGTIELDAAPSSDEYGGFEGITVTPGTEEGDMGNAYILCWPGDRSWTEPEDSSFTFYLAHDSQYLYIGVDVLDDVVNSDNDNKAFWKDDAVEIVVDALNDRYDLSTEGPHPYGGHCYFNYEGRMSEWDDGIGQDPDNRWCTAVDWTYGEEEDSDIWAYGEETDDGWALEIRMHKRLFQDPAAGNELDGEYTMGINIGLDDDDARGPEGTNGDGSREKDLEIQYWWSNRLYAQGWNAGEAGNYTPEQIEDREYMDDFPLVLDADGRLKHGGTGEIIFLPGPHIDLLFRRADANGDSNVDLSDAVYILSYLFLGAEPPACAEGADTNGNGDVDITDGIYLLTALFLGGPVPPAPYPDCGFFSGEGSLGCETYPGSCQ